jgi:hypothetical protein
MVEILSTLSCMILIIVPVVCLLVARESCPAGGFHDWRYTGHWLDLADFECDKCDGEKTEQRFENDINFLEYEKDKREREW